MRFNMKNFKKINLSSGFYVVVPCATLILTSIGRVVKWIGKEVREHEIFLKIFRQI